MELREGNCGMCGQAEGYCEHTKPGSRWRLEAARKIVEAAFTPKPEPAKKPTTPPSTTIWKIRAADGSFSKGGYSIGPHTFSKNGKTWHRASDVTSHLAQLDERSLRQYDSVGAKIVSYEIVPTGDIKIMDWIAAADERRAKRQESAQVRQERIYREQLAQEIERKKKELETLQRKLERPVPYG